MSFIGNTTIIERLQKMAEGEAKSHSLLFVGPEHTGKFTLAKTFASAVIVGEHFDPSSINETALGQDSIIITPPVEVKKGISRTKNIDAETVREAREKMMQSPTLGHARVCIINDAHKMTAQAQNALLKILEEPVGKAVFILVTHLPGSILPTIHSRCETLEFCDIPREDFFACDRFTAFSDIETLWRLSLGRVGLAIELLENEESFMQRKSWLEFLVALPHADLKSKFSFVEELSKDKEKVIDFLLLWEFLLAEDAHRDASRILANYAQLERIERALETIQTTNAQTRLVVEMLFV